MDHPLAMDVEAMRRTGHAAVDALLRREKTATAL
jgi:hypothetical protein